MTTGNPRKIARTNYYAQPLGAMRYILSAKPNRRLGVVEAQATSSGKIYGYRHSTHGMVGTSLADAATRLDQLSKQA